MTMSASDRDDLLLIGELLAKVCIAVPITISATFFMPPTVRRSRLERRVADGAFGGGRRQQLVLERARRGDQRQAALERAPHQHARDQQAVDLVGALEDPVHARVAVVPLGG